MEMLNAMEMMDYSAQLQASLTPDKLTDIVTRANRLGLIESLMDILGVRPATKNNEPIVDARSGKILIIGNWSFDDSVLKKIARKTKIDVNRFEVCAEYHKLKSQSFESIRYSNKYAAVLFGAIPHKVKDLNGSSSLIARMETEPGFPPVERIGCNENKLTTSGIIQALRKLKDEGIIQ